MESKKTRSRRVLIIDDDADYTELLAASLRGSSLEVSIRNFGESGLEEAKRTQPDLIVLDIMMPGIHGLYALEELRKDERTAQTPVIVVSSMERGEADQTAATYGADFIHKDAGIPEIAARIKKRMGVG